MAEISASGKMLRRRVTIESLANFLDRSEFHAEGSIMAEAGIDKWNAFLRKALRHVIGSASRAFFALPVGFFFLWHLTATAQTTATKPANLILSGLPEP